MKKIAAIGISAAIIALGAVASTVHSDAPDCITAGLDDDTCVWKPELASVEVKVEYEYPYCEIKLEVEDNLDELPEGVSYSVATGLIYVPPQEDVKVLTRSDMRFSYYVYPGSSTSLISSYYNSSRGRKPHWTVDWTGHDLLHAQFGQSGRGRDWRFGGNKGNPVEFAKFFSGWQTVTLGTIHAQVQLEYGESYKTQVRVGDSFDYTNHASKLPAYLISSAIPISHTFAGLSEEIFTCGEVAKREKARMEERKALETERAGLRQSLALLEAELARARAHETNAANLLNEVIEIGERVGEVHRTIQRIRVEGLAERRKMIERYYTEESAKYSLVLRSLEAQEAAMAAADAAIAAQKAELEASRARLEKMVADAQAAEDALIAEIEKTREALGDGE